MSEIHYFPRYAQSENIVTNNTMLLLKRLYTNSADKFNQFLNVLIENGNTDAAISTAIKFEQHIKGKGILPDASISQESFRIVIETKSYNQHHISQIRSHFSTFGNEKHQVFLWINPDPIDTTFKQIVLDEISDFNVSHHKEIKFASITFKEVNYILQSIIREDDYEMKQIIYDFEAFCSSLDLINNADTKMRIVPSGSSFEQNMEYNVFYDNRTNEYQNHKYIGLYKDTAVRGIGKIVCIADIDYNKVTYGLIKASILEGTLSQQMEMKLITVIKQAKQQFGYDLTSNQRFFFVDGFYRTHFKKKTPYGVIGTRYIDLESVGGFSKNIDISEIAEVLRGKSWG